MKNVLFLALFLVGCTNSTKTENKETQTTENQAIEETTVLNRTECFRNEISYTDGSDKKDIEELILNINYQVENGEVTGIYNYLPAEKDQRKGSFKGILKGKTINASYIFMQEGIEDTTSITILLENNKVTINTIDKGDKGLGLNTTMPKIDCKK